MSSRRASSPARRQRGVALLIVLWVLALLSALLVGFAGDTTTELLVARNQYESAHARAIADAGVTLAIIGVLDPAPETQWPADGSVRTLTYDGGTIRVKVQDEAGKIDLNATAPEAIENLMRTLGIAAADAERVAQSIVEWRQAHQRASMIDSSGQLPVRTPGRMPDAAFVAVEQLRLVPGVTRDLYERLFPYVTVYSAVPTIDPVTAPEMVLRSLPGVSPEEIETFLAQRQQAATNPAVAATLTGATFVAHQPLQVGTITSEGRTGGGAIFIREAVVALTREPSKPYYVLAWRQGRPEQDDAATGAAGDAASSSASWAQNWGR